MNNLGDLGDLGDEDGKINPLAGMGLSDDEYSAILANIVNGETFGGVGMSLGVGVGVGSGLGMGVGFNGGLPNQQQQQQQQQGFPMNVVPAVPSIMQSMQSGGNGTATFAMTTTFGLMEKRGLDDLNDGRDGKRSRFEVIE